MKVNDTRAMLPLLKKGHVMFGKLGVNATYM
jgi:hypothetical protein